jgi:hypothetical protein
MRNIMRKRAAHAGVPRVPVAASAEEDEDAKALRELEASMAL